MWHSANWVKENGQRLFTFAVEMIIVVYKAEVQFFSAVSELVCRRGETAPARPYSLNVYNPPFTASGSMAARNTDRIPSSRCYAGVWLASGVNICRSG